MNAKGYSKPISDLAGVNTLVDPKIKNNTDPDTSGPDHHQTPNNDKYNKGIEKKVTNNIEVGKTTFNGADETSGIVNRPRTLARPGDSGSKYETPVRDRVTQRRVDSAMPMYIRDSANNSRSIFDGKKIEKENNTNHYMPESNLPGDITRSKIPGDALDHGVELGGESSSARVIPRHNVAKKLEWFDKRLLPKIKDSANNLNVPLSENLTVKEGYHSYKIKEYTVSLMRDKKGNYKIHCTCPFWKYYGPTFWSKKFNYFLKEEDTSDISPDIRDPLKKQFLCKHAYHVLHQVEELYKNGSL